MSFSIPLLATLFMGEATAGGIGVLTHAGVHQGRSYYYLGDRQGIDSQFNPQFGAGMEALIGDKDDRLQGLIRLYWNQDMPLKEPTFDTGDSYVYPAEHELNARNDGMVSVGLQWGLWGEPTAFQLVATTSLVSCFWTIDNLEHVAFDLGVGATYTLGERIQLHGNLALTPRYRKQISFAANTYAGVRYLFD